MSEISEKRESLSLYDLPKFIYERSYEDIEEEQSDKIILQNTEETEGSEERITLELYKRLLQGPKEKDLSVFDRERYYHPEDAPETEENLTSIQKLSKISKIVIMLCHGGYFSGAVFDKKNVIAHKTFHHYVSRKKQGGRQSTRDKTGHRPKSGGASIRRYNEQKHANEIRELFHQWKHYLNDADLIFTHFPGSNRGDFFMDKDISNEDSKLVKSSKGNYYFHKNDKRIRPLPFTTQRPNYSRVRGVFVKLTTIRVTTCISSIPLDNDFNDLRSSTEYVVLLSDDEEDDEDDFCAPDEDDEEEEDEE